ncbi:MAG: ATP-binding cassette domain-containing protein [Chthoniobacter sp.]
MPPILSVSHLTVRRGDTHILDDLSWTVQRGEHWVILGANGSGKTSLLSSLIGYLSPTSGVVSVLGQTFGESDWRDLRLHIGIVSSRCAPDAVLNRIITLKDTWAKEAHKG